ncbi:hypothetical protein H6F95_18285 [Cyanobacteria bacterium FACHB-471]|nr:hypothetical protein [Cyanobacteria bacterium FACHB-471]
MPIALALYWNAAQFYIFYSTGLLSSKYILALKYSLDILTVITALTLNYSYTRNILRQVKAVIIRKATWCLGVIAFAIGLVSFYYFPYAFDNAQLAWTQHLVRPEISFWASSNYGQIGYSALIYYIGNLFDYIPLTTISSAFKPVLFILILLCCLYIFEQLQYKPLWLFSGFYFLILFFSAFGQWGAFITGKPSIYGVVLSMVFFASFLKPFKEIKFSEAHLYFSVAAFSGIIAIPYMVMFSVFLFLTSTERKTLIREFRNLTIIAFFPLFVAASYATSLSPTLVVIGLLISLLIISLLMNIDFDSAKNYQIFNNLFFLRRTAFLPLIGIVASYFLMPATLMPGSRSPFPLDGTTTLFEYLLHQDKRIAPVVIILGMIGAILLPFIVKRKDSFGIQALCIWPIATIVFVLIVVHLNIPLPLHPAIFWNIIKDVVQWYGGPLFGLLMLLLIVQGFVLFKQRIKEARLLPFNKDSIVRFVGIFLSTAIFLGHVGYFQKTLAYRSPTFTSIGGHGNPDYALLAEHIWSHPGVRTFIVTDNSSQSSSTGVMGQVIRHHGSNPVKFNQAQNIDNWLGRLEKEQRFWILIDNSHVATFFEWLDRQKGSSEYAMPLDHNTRHLFFVKLDQRGESTPPSFVERNYELGTWVKFNNGENGWIYSSFGWTEPGSWGSWTVGNEALLTMALDKSSSSSDILLSAKTRAFIRDVHPRLDVDVIVNGEQVAQWEFVHGQADDGARTAILPASLVNKQSPLQITFSIPNAKSLAELGLGGDQRQFGLGMRELRLSEINSSQ